MRLQSIKLLILLFTVLSAVAVAGRLTWFLVKGRQEILRPADGHDPYPPKRSTQRGAEQPPTNQLYWWWKDFRRGFLVDRQKAPAGPRAKLEQYAILGTVDISGEIPPEPKEVTSPQIPNSKLPYDAFRFVKVKTLILGDGVFAGDDRVMIEHKVDPPRPQLKDAGKILGDIYGVGQHLAALPEIKVERIERDKGTVVFRMPKIKDPRGLYEGYKGDESDSQLVSITLVDFEALPVERGMNAVASGTSRPSPKTVARTLPDGRKAPKRTRETRPGSGVWELGTEDLEEWKGDYSERLDRDVSVSSYNRGGVSGLHIQRIDESSPFYGRGLMKNDVILSLNSHKIPTKSAAVRYIREHSEQRTYLIEVLRNGRKREILYQVPR